MILYDAYAEIVDMHMDWVDVDSTVDADGDTLFCSEDGNVYRCTGGHAAACFHYNDYSALLVLLKEIAGDGDAFAALLESGHSAEFSADDCEQLAKDFGARRKAVPPGPLLKSYDTLAELFETGANDGKVMVS